MENTLLNSIEEEIVESDISPHDLRIILDIIKKYENDLKEPISKL